MSEDRDSERGFTVSDRRRFSTEGTQPGGEDERRERDASGVASPAGGGAEAGGADASRAASMDPDAEHGRPLPEITLSTFVLSLSTQGLMHLGEIPNPIDKAVRQDLTAAKQIIDILGLLREKTKGNLDESEEALFDDILYDLRMRYVDLSRRGRP